MSWLYIVSDWLFIDILILIELIFKVFFFNHVLLFLLIWAFALGFLKRFRNFIVLLPAESKQSFIIIFFWGGKLNVCLRAWLWHLPQKARFRRFGTGSLAKSPFMTSLCDIPILVRVIIAVAVCLLSCLANFGYLRGGGGGDGGRGSGGRGSRGGSSCRLWLAETSSLFDWVRLFILVWLQTVLSFKVRIIWLQTLLRWVLIKLFVWDEGGGGLSFLWCLLNGLGFG